MKASIASLGCCVAIGQLAAASTMTWYQHSAVRQDISRHTGVATLDVSADGRFVAFESRASLTPDATDQRDHIYVQDRSSGRITLESVSVEGASANGASSHPRLSADGRYLVFASLATNIVASTGQVNQQVFLRDRHTGAVQLVSRGRSGAPADGWSDDPEISDDGNAIVFTSAARDLVGTQGASLNARDVYAFDVRQQTIERVNVDNPDGQPRVGSAMTPAVSGDGRFVAFAATGPPERSAPFAMFKQPAAPRPLHVFLTDRVRRSTRVISPTGRVSDGSSFHPAISGDGRWLAFTSSVGNLDARDRNGVADVFLHDTNSGRTALVSRGVNGRSGDGPSDHPVLSFDGRYVAFVSMASDLRCARRCSAPRADVNLVSDVYRFDTVTSSMERVSGAETPWWEASAGPALDASGDVVAFSSRHPRDATDMAHDLDLFVFASRAALAQPMTRR